MTDFDIMGSNLNGAQGGAPSSGFDIIGPNAGGRPLYGQPQNGAGQPGPQTVNGVAYNTTGSAPQNGAGQPVPQQQGAPVSGLLAGILGLPTYSGAIPGAAYTTPQQQMQQTGGGQMQAPQISQMAQTNDGMSGLSQPQAPGDARAGEEAVKTRGLLSEAQRSNLLHGDFALVGRVVSAAWMTNDPAKVAGKDDDADLQ